MTLASSLDDKLHAVHRKYDLKAAIARAILRMTMCGASMQASAMIANLNADTSKRLVPMLATMALCSAHGIRT